MGCGTSQHGLLFLSEVPTLDHYHKMLEHHERLRTPGQSTRGQQDSSLSRVNSIEELRDCPRPIDKYIKLRQLSESDPEGYYELMLMKTEEILPYIYTPTVGEACQNYHKLPGLKPHGVFITLEDRGKILSVLSSKVKKSKVEIIVVTDGERILGLGDLGANGMGISEGKITLYTACAGVDPSHCLPVCLDMGTNNKALLADPAYKGLRRNRASVEEFDAILSEFMSAVQSKWGHVVVQFEDFGNGNAFRLLENFEGHHPCFNDDIQGTASICLAAILTGLRISGGELKSQTILFLGAGEAGTGIGQLIAYCLHKRYGMSLIEARSHCYFVDSKGLVCHSRSEQGLQDHKKAFAHDVPFCADLKAAIRQLRPSVLIGVSAQPKEFDEEVIKLMAKINTHPIIMPLSNPTSQAECTFKEAFDWTEGKVIFASGSPFNPLESKSGTIYPAQANNVSSK